ncbi:MAG: twin-arginine translocase TatA/TatE family subunit [Chloroflexota bacterium]
MPFPNIGAPELIVILIIALVVLGPGKLPDVAASLGKSVREFRKAATDVSDAAKVTPLDSPANPASPTPVAPNTLTSSTEPNVLKAADPTADQKLS